MTINICLSQRKRDIYIDELVYSEDFRQAIVLYKQIVLFDPQNPLYLYNLGFCYLNTRMSKDSSIIYLKNSIKYYSKQKHKKVMNIEEVYFYLGRAYRINNYYDSATAVLTKLKLNTTNRKFKKIIDNELTLINTASELYKQPVNFNVENIGNQVNTPFTEHTPILSIDENKLIFTSRRANNGKILLYDEQYDEQYDEDIYISEKDDKGLWTTPVAISKNINTAEHEASIGLSYDGLQLFIYKEEDEGSIYFSKFDGEDWTKPVKLNENINTRFRETHASLSLDGNFLYFTSARPGGIGGQDIYMSQKNSDGQWGQAVNLGNSINTTSDEEGPYIHPDGKTLYFSSKGHKGMGGHDIFKSVRDQNGLWLKPTNIGYPINTVEDDIFYFPTADGTRAYYSSIRENSIGRSDIYVISLPQEKPTELVVMTGILTHCSETRPQAQITITDIETKEYLVATPDKKGKFIFVTQRNHNYNIIIETETKIILDEKITITDELPFINLYKIIRLDPEVNCDKQLDTLAQEELNTLLIDSLGNVYDQFIEIENILFDFGKANQVKENESLDKLTKYLIDNKEAIVEIGAFADAKGEANYNYNLSIRRGETLKKYMTDKGLNAKQLIVSGYGEENPIAYNKNLDGTWNTEGQKYNRRAEFKVIQQGKTTLLIWQLKVPEELKNPNYKPNYNKKKNSFIEIEY